MSSQNCRVKTPKRHRWTESLVTLFHIDKCECKDCGIERHDIKKATRRISYFNPKTNTWQEKAGECKVKDKHI